MLFGRSTRSTAVPAERRRVLRADYQDDRAQPIPRQHLDRYGRRCFRVFHPATQLAGAGLRRIAHPRGIMILRHMKTRALTSKQIDELVAFLPRLYPDGLAPIKEWGGGTKDPDGAYVMPWPRYQEVVEEFFRVAARECWTDYDYDPLEAGRLLMNEDAVRTADLAQIKTLLTYCVRGERFSDGHWAAMVEGGHIRRLLERLAAL